MNVTTLGVQTGDAMNVLHNSILVAVDLEYYTKTTASTNAKTVNTHKTVLVNPTLPTVKSKSTVCAIKDTLMHLIHKITSIVKNAHIHVLNAYKHTTFVQNV